MTTRDEPGFGKFKLILGLIGLSVYCARSDTEVLSVGCWKDASRPRFNSKRRRERGDSFSISVGAENESRSR